MFPGVISRDDAPHVSLIRVGAGHGDRILTVEQDGSVREDFYGRSAGKLRHSDGAALRELDQAIVLFEDDIFGVSRRIRSGLTFRALVLVGIRPLPDVIGQIGLPSRHG